MTREVLIGKYPPAEPGALNCEPNQSHTQPCLICKLCHAQKKLAAPSIAFWSVVQIDDELLNP